VRHIGKKANWKSLRPLLQPVSKKAIEFAILFCLQKEKKPCPEKEEEKPSNPVGETKGTGD